MLYSSRIAILNVVTSTEARTLKAENVSPYFFYSGN